MMTKIYLLRHGEVHNPKQIVYARLPRFKLSKKGIEEITETALFLKDKNIKAIYSSPLLRARQTAEIIKSTLGIKQGGIVEQVSEVVTSLQGESNEKLQLDYYSPPILKKSDESMEQIAKRMLSAMEILAKHNHGKSITVISHGDPIMILQAYLTNLPLKIASLRIGRYLQHGEVLLLQSEDDKNFKVKSVFTPH